MTPASAIAALDRQIALHGQTVILRRGNGPQQKLQAFVRGYQPAEIVGLIKDGDRRLTFSPSTFGPLGSPRKGDAIPVPGRQGVILDDIETIYIGDELVRVNVRVRLSAGV